MITFILQKTSTSALFSNHQVVNGPLILYTYKELFTKIRINSLFMTKMCATPHMKDFKEWSRKLISMKSYF